jgi:hypothetical protein
MKTTIEIPQLETIENKIDLILQKIENNEKSNSKELFLSRDEAAEMLKIDVVTVDTHRRNGLISGFKVGRRRLYKIEEIINLSNLIKK